MGHNVLCKLYMNVSICDVKTVHPKKHAPANISTHYINFVLFRFPCFKFKLTFQHHFTLLFPFFSLTLIILTAQFTEHVAPTTTLHKTAPMTPIASFPTNNDGDQPTASNSLVDISVPVIPIEPSVTPKEQDTNAEQALVILIISMVVVFMSLMVIAAGIIVLCMVARKRCRRHEHLKDKVVSKSSIDNPVYDARVLTESRDYAVPVSKNPAYSLHVHTAVHQGHATANDYETCRAGPLEYLKPVALFNAIPGFAKPVKKKHLTAQSDRIVSTGSAIYETPIAPTSFRTEGAKDSIEPRHYELAVSAVNHSDHEAVSHSSGSNTSVVCSPGYDVPIHSLDKDYSSHTNTYAVMDTISNASDDKNREDVKSWIHQNGSSSSLNEV